MKIKLGVSLLLAFLVFVFVTQNTETVQVKFLLWSLEMSLVLMVFIMFVAGVLIGWLVSSYVRYASHRKVPAASAKSVAGPSAHQPPVPGREAAQGEDRPGAGGDPVP